MADIKQLPPSVINKIAAGEVIERPASLVKELLENSVDAGAHRIEVAVGRGGTELVRVSDDGCGIVEEQLPLAVASHATSKIRDADDLFHVGTLGFRGEALASIAEVSRFTLRSRTTDSSAGFEMEVNGGSLGEIVPCGCPVGTTVEVRDLFFNTPVRRKFMRTTQTEMGHISETFMRVALAHPGVHFTLRHNEKIVYDAPPVENWRQRIAILFGGELAAGLIGVESADGPVRLIGYVADPQFSRGNNRMQYLLLNGRYIRDRSLGHALGEAYRGLLLTGRYPITFLRIEMPPEMVDVNVHPTKLEVRFQEGGRLYSQLLGTLRKKFLTTDLTAKVQSVAATSDATASVDGAGAAMDAQYAQQHRRQLADWAKGQLPASAEQADQGALDLQYESTGGAGLEITRLDRPWPAARQSSHTQFAVPSNDLPPSNEPQGPSALQIHNRYIVTEDESGVVIIDQHALHERILYEDLREKVMLEKMETQRLLVPEPVSLTAAEAAAALEQRDLLSQLGIELEPFGGDTVLVSSYPAMLANLGPAELVRQVVEQLLEGGKAPDRRDLLDELLHMISCKAAVKAGDRLSQAEISALVQRRHLCQDSHHCPHGRPTALVFTREELDRRFKRT